LIFGISHSVTTANGKLLGINIKSSGPFAAFIIVILLGLYFNNTIPKKIKLNVQVHGKKGLDDLPIKNLINSLNLIPTNNNSPVLASIDQNGMARFELDKDYFGDTVRLQLVTGNYEIVDPTQFILAENKELMLTVMPKKINYVFRFKNKNDYLSGIRFVSEELGIDTVSSVNGSIKFSVDTTGIQTYNFRILSPLYKWKGPTQYFSYQSDLTFTLEKNRQ
jgi:hypothetical protein